MKDTIADVMTRDVVSIGPDASFRDAVGLVQENRVHGLPVLDADGRVIGMVTQSDLLLKEEILAGAAAGIAVLPHARRQRAKAAAMTVRRLMSTPPVTVAPGARLHEAACMLAKRRIGRLPVVDAGNRLVGIVTRSDLLSVYLRTDDELRVDVEEALDRVLREVSSQLQLEVVDGVLHLSGELERRSDVVVALGAVRRVPGLCEVQERVTCRYDDVNVGLVGY
jgi:CBS domain-containing protein